MSENKTGAPPRAPKTESLPIFDISQEDYSTFEHEAPFLREIAFRQFLKTLPDEIRMDAESAFKEILENRLGSKLDSTDRFLTSGFDILQTNFPPIKFLIDGLLTPGLVNLSARPKTGKSWLALQACIKISTGAEFFGRATTEGSALYVALEDSGRRIQHRMQRQNWSTSASKNVDFLFDAGFRERIGLLDQGGVEKLARLIERNSYRLTVIDTFSRSTRSDQRDEVQMTHVLGPLQRFALTSDVTVMVIDHHRKPAAGSTSVQNVIDDVLGSTAKSAVYDLLWGLYRERGKRGARLTVIGREIEEQNLQIAFNQETFMWDYLGDSAIEITERRREILTFLGSADAQTATEIAVGIGQPPSHTHDRLQDLADAGLVIREDSDDGIFYSLKS